MSEAVSAEDAKAYLANYAPNEDVIKGMDETQVLEYHKRVSTANSKAVEEALKAANENRAPEKYELKRPEGSKLTEEALAEISSIAKENKLTNAEAQLLLNTRSQAIDAVHSSQQQQLKTLQEGWREAVKKDPVLGGEKLAETQRLTQLVIDNAMDDELRSFLKETGYGDHPAVVRFLRKIGSEMGEGKPPNSGQGGSGSGETKDPANVMYDNKG